MIFACLVIGPYIARDRCKTRNHLSVSDLLQHLVGVVQSTLKRLLTFDVIGVRSYVVVAFMFRVVSLI